MKPRILLVTPASPFVVQSGAQQRTALLYGALTALGTVDVLLLSDGTRRAVEKSTDPRVLAEAHWRSLPAGINKYGVDRRLTQLCREHVPFADYDLVVGRYLNPICKLKLPSSARTLVDLDDWGYSYRETRSGGLPNCLARAKSGYARLLADRQIRRFDAFFFLSERDRTGIHDVVSEVLPNIPFAPPTMPLSDNPSSKQILFVGALWYGPNREGIEFFLDHCWPDIRTRVPDATLLLVGAAEPALRERWASLPGVSAPGFVDDLGEAYKNAAFTIAPIHFGGGTNIKVLESLAYGRACVTTPHCSAAFPDLEAAMGLVVARTTKEFIDACVSLLSDTSLRTQHAEAGRRVVESAYVKDRYVRTVSKLCTRLLA